MSKRARPAAAEGKSKRPRAEPEPVDLVDDAWREVARAGGESVACKMMFISKGLRWAVSTLPPALRRLRHSWFYYIAGHRTLIEGDVKKDNTVKSFDRYKVKGTVWGGTQKLIGYKTIYDMMKGAARFGHLDNLKLLVASRGPGYGLPYHLGYSALRGQNTELLVYLAAEYRGKAMRQLGQSKVRKLATKVGPAMFGLMDKHHVVTFPTDEALVLGIIRSGRRDVAECAIAHGKWLLKEYMHEDVGEALARCADADTLAWFDWLRHIDILPNELVLAYLKKRMARFCTGPGLSTRRVIGGKLATRDWYGMPRQAICDAVFEALLPGYGISSKDLTPSDIELFDWFVTTLGIAPQRLLRVLLQDGSESPMLAVRKYGHSHCCL